MNITVFEKKIINLLVENKKIIFVVFLTISALALRISLFNFLSDDYLYFLDDWVKLYRHYGGINGLAYHIGDYNCVYCIILALISYLPINSLYSIKVVSVLFDWLCACAGYKIIKEVTGKTNLSLIAYVLLMLSPTSILNSGAWAQCDSIYTFFALLAIYYLIKERFILSFIFAGISFSFKLQFVFILPVFIIYYICKKRFSILNFFIIPLINMVFAIPAILLGRDIYDILTIYLVQAEEYGHYFTMNFPNMYTLLGSFGSIKYLGIGLCILMFGILLYVILSKDIQLTKENILLLCTLSPIIATFFLPHMHDRYLYLADVFSIIWCIANQNKKYIYLPIAINLFSYSTYTNYLFYNPLLNDALKALLFMLIIIKFIFDIYKSNFDLKLQ